MDRVQLFFFVNDPYVSPNESIIDGIKPVYPVVA